MGKIIKSQTSLKDWSIKLRLHPDEERRIKKDAIDCDMRVAEYIKHKLLDNLSNKKIQIENKSA